MQFRNDYSSSLTLNISIMKDSLKYEERAGDTDIDPKEVDFALDE